MIGVRFSGALRAGVTATDLVLTLTELLRHRGVVGSFVEFCGDGLSALSLADRATLSNMCPEFGATSALFPVDDETLRYLRRPGRGDAAELVERYTKAQGLFRRDGDAVPAFDDLVELDLASVEASLAGPSRPQDRVALASVADSFHRVFGSRDIEVPVALNGDAGDDAARRLGRDRGDHVVHEHLEPVRHGRRGPARPERDQTRAPHEALGQDEPRPGVARRHRLPRRRRAHAVPRPARLPARRLRLHDLHRELGAAARRRQRGCAHGELAVAAVLSGNRNFEGRIHPQVRASYLASPPLVVAYALAGRVDTDLAGEPLGHRLGGAAGLPARAVAAGRRDRGGHRGGADAGPVRPRVRTHLGRRRALACARRADRGAVRVRARLDLRARAAVPRAHRRAACAARPTSSTRAASRWSATR